MQFGFMPGRGMMYILRQLQDLAKNLYFAFVDLEKAFDRVPRKVLVGHAWHRGICAIRAGYLESILMNLESKLEFTRVST